jgi:hypothetical protein
MASAALAAPDADSARAAVVELLDDEARAVLAAE